MAAPSSPSPPTEPTISPQDNDRQLLPSRPKLDPSASTLTTSTLIPHLQSWLTSNSSKISTFWIGADWNKWTRFELFCLLEPLLKDTCLVSHSLPLYDTNLLSPHADTVTKFPEIKLDDQEVDIFIEPTTTDTGAGSIAIKILCERVSENEGSFERFRKRMDDEIALLQYEARNCLDPVFDGSTLLFVGFSGPAMENEDSEWVFRSGEGDQKGPMQFGVGEVNMWIMKWRVPER